MNSFTTAAFRRLYESATPQRQAKIRRAYRLWQENPAHPSLRFKKIHATEAVYSVRVDLDWRALGVMEADAIVWFWVGPHDQYLALLGQLRCAKTEPEPGCGKCNGDRIDDRLRTRRGRHHDPVCRPSTSCPDRDRASHNRARNPERRRVGAAIAAAIASALPAIDTCRRARVTAV